MNPWLQFADSIRTRRKPASRPRVLLRDSQAPKAPTAAEKEIREQTVQFRRYLRWKALDLKHLMEGEVGPEIRELRKILRDLAPGHSAPLLKFLRDHDWFLHLDKGSRYAILDLIDAAIIRMRVREGLPPIDDSLPGEAPTVFEIIREGLQL